MSLPSIFVVAACNECSSPTTTVCGDCRSVYYCSRHCRAIQHSSHHDVCVMYARSSSRVCSESTTSPSDATSTSITSAAAITIPVASNPFNVWGAHHQREYAQFMTDRSDEFNKSEDGAVTGASSVDRSQVIWVVYENKQVIHKSDWMEQRIALGHPDSATNILMDAYSRRPRDVDIIIVKRDRSYYHTRFTLLKACDPVTMPTEAVEVYKQQDVGIATATTTIKVSDDVQISSVTDESSVCYTTSTSSSVSIISFLLSASTSSSSSHLLPFDFDLDIAAILASNCRHHSVHTLMCIESLMVQYLKYEYRRYTIGWEVTLIEEVTLSAIKQVIELTNNVTVISSVDIDDVMTHRHYGPFDEIEAVGIIIAVNYFKRQLNRAHHRHAYYHHNKQAMRSYTMAVKRMTSIYARMLDR